MKDRRRFLHVLGASFVSAAGVGCSDGDDGGDPASPGAAGSGQGGSAGSGQGGSAGSNAAGAGQGGANTAGSGQGGSPGGAGGGGEAGAGGAGGAGGSNPPGIAIGTPGDFPDKGLHQIPTAKVLLGLDDGGYYALSALCTHQNCNMAGAQGKVEVSGSIRCTCHGSIFTPNGSVEKGPASKPLPAFALALGEDGKLYVDTKTKVDAAVRLVV